MKVNLKKIGAVLAGATILASSGFAALTYGDLELVNVNGQPVAKVVVGENAAASDGVAAAHVAAKFANEAFAKKTLKAMVKGAGEGGSGATVTDKSVTLKVTMPGLSSTQQASFNMLIAETTDNDLQDRDSSGDAYDNADDLLDSDSNPFQDQVGGTTPLNFGGIEEYNYTAVRADGENFVAFDPVRVSSAKFGTEATEYQYAYVKGNSEFDSSGDEVVFVGDSALYQVVFGTSDQGLHVCPGDVSENLSTCDDADGMGAARYQIDFLGRSWVISGSSHSAGASSLTTSVDSDKEVSTPGTSKFILKLAREGAHAVINVGECLEADDVRVCLDDISEGTGTDSKHPAILSVYVGDEAEPTAKDQVNPGASKEISVGGGQQVTVHVFQTAPGYTFGSSWAEVSIFEDEIELESGKDFLDSESLDEESDWNVYFGLVNDDATSTTNTTNVGSVTHIKHITLAADGDDPFDAVDSDGLGEGDSMPILDVPGYQAFELENLGLTDSEMETLTYELKGSKDFNAVDVVGNLNINYNLTAEKYVRISSESTEQFKDTSAGEVDHLYILWDDSNATDAVDAGDTIYVVSEDEDGQMYILANNTSANFEYRIAGDDFGRIFLHIDNPNVTGATKTNITYREDAGEINATDRANELSTSIDWGNDQFHSFNGTTSDDDKIWYNYSHGALNGYGYSNNSKQEEDFITLRGSVVTDLAEKDVKIDVATKMRHLQLVLKPSGVSTEPNAQLIGPLREGESDTVQDVTIEVESIDVQLSSATGGATGDLMAVIVDEATGAELGETYDAMVRYSTGPLVMLDSEVTDDTGVLVTIGGNAVNSLTAAAMDEAGLELTPDEAVMVRAVGNKVVVAGYTAEDTLAAAEQFLAALQSN